MFCVVNFVSDFSYQFSITCPVHISPFAAKRPYKKRKTAQSENREGEVGAALSAGGVKEENNGNSAAALSSADNIAAAEAAGSKDSQISSQEGSLSNDPARGVETDSEEDAA